jgi:hypothetical protein
MRPIISLLSLCLLLVLASAVFAAPGVKTDFTTDASGNLQTRFITPGNVGPINDGNLPPAFGIDQTVLWMTEDATAIAQNVDITGNGQNIVAGWWLNNMRTSKYATQGTGSPIWEYPQAVNFFLPVSASDDGGVIASTGSQIPLSVWTGGAGPTPTWQYTYPATYQGVDCDVSDNGFYVAAVCTRADTAAYGKLLVFNASSSALLWEVNFDAGPQANGVEISENNQWIVVSSYSHFYVYDLTTQTLFFTGPNYSQTVCGIDDDAEWLAEGDFYGMLHVYRRIGSSYVEQWTNSLGGWVTAVDISSDASTVLAGNYTYSPSNAGLVRGFNINGTVLWTYNQYGDYVADVALCNNGTVGVAGSWGQLDATFGDVFTAFSMGTGTVILQLRDDLDEPGSIFDVAISDNGAFAACGGKAVHARQFGNGGETYSLELVTVIQNIEITLTPVNPPIIIPPGGGSFNYNITFTNTGPDTISFQGWIMIELPSGRYYGPVLGPVGLTLAPGASITRMRTQSISGHAPSGAYNYIGFAGTYPSVIADSSYFPFAKSGSGDGNLEPETWPNIGDPLATENGSLLHSTLPNPFNPTTTIRFELRDASFVRLGVYDISGRLVMELANGWREAGVQEVTFDGSKLASGIYVYRIAAGDFSASGKMMLMK